MQEDGYKNGDCKVVAILSLGFSVLKNWDCDNCVRFFGTNGISTHEELYVLLTQCGQVIPYGDIDLGVYCLR